MRFVRGKRATAGEIAETSCVPLKAVASVVGGMERCGYITVDRDRKDFGSGRGVKSSTLLRPSMVGELAISKWEHLTDDIEERWTKRFGAARVDALRSALSAVEIPLALPHFLPIIGPSNGFFTYRDYALGGSPDASLPALMSRVLLMGTLDYESSSDVSLALASTRRMTASSASQEES